MPDGLKQKLKRFGRCDKRHTTCNEADRLRLLACSNQRSRSWFDGPFIR